MTGVGQISLTEGGETVSEFHVFGVLQALVRLRDKHPEILRQLALYCQQEIPAMRKIPAMQKSHAWTLIEFGLIRVDGLICDLVAHIMRFCTELKDDGRISFHRHYYLG